eukprot:GFUD01039876.1.p1 GENE.GFUD01039876.1~~GFUD01039876.1.p1  ORF type:complete len:122 (+),score=13.18 GFUD01039876.1:57-422(+)
MSIICETFFKGVKVKRLDDEANSVNVYNKPVVVQLEYDPKGMLVKITEESEQKEFIVSKGSEFARVGLPTESLLLTFASDQLSWSTWQPRSWSWLVTQPETIRSRESSLGTCSWRSGMTRN